MERVMLYFGSFNPVHKGHIALAEYVLEKGLCDRTVLIVSPQSPYKQAAGLAPVIERFEMAEIACAASKYPDRIQASAVETLLPQPSYTIDTLRFLEEQCGGKMRFSILMGADQIEGLDGWKEAERILEYPIYVYPRRGEKVSRHTDRIIVLDDAPLQDFAATDIRTRIPFGEDVSAMVHPKVLAYIRDKGLWSAESVLRDFDARIEERPDEAAYLARGKHYYRLNRWGDALNDFNRALSLNPDSAEAQQYARMVREILDFRYKDIYNP